MSPVFNNKIISKSHISSYEDLFLVCGYEFKNTTLLIEALTHPSSKISVKTKDYKGVIDAKMDDIFQDKFEYSNCDFKKGSKPFNYERLEFLGDRVLSFVLGDILFQKFPDDSEGQLSKKYSNLACGAICVEVAKSINLEKYIIMSIGEDKYNGRKNLSNLENVMEALIGAVFLDGGIENAIKFIKKHWKSFIDKVSTVNLLDPKSFLQEWSQIKFHVLPKYTLKEVKGTDHEPLFIIEVSIDGVNEKFIGIGGSKKESEKNAAKEMMEKLKLKL